MSHSLHADRPRRAGRHSVARAELWRALAESVPALLLLVDADGVVQYANRDAARLPGLAPGHCALDLAPTESRAALRAALADVLTSDGARTRVQRIALPDRTERWFAVRASRVVIDGEVVGAAVVLRDVTERRRLELHVRECQRMDALAQLCAAVAHDLANVLTIAGSAAQVTLDTLGPDHECADDVRAIVTAAQRGGALTAQLVATARRKRLAVEAVDLNEVVRTTLDLFQRALDERVRVVQRLDARGAPARLNWSQAEQVVMNLLLNARDAVAMRGGTITVSTMRRHARTTLRVDDDGVGMSEAVRRRVFERFFTTKEAAGGTGLGLATVHAVVARAGGRVRVESAPGAGASFGVELPAPESMAAAG